MSVLLVSISCRIPVITRVARNKNPLQSFPVIKTPARCYATRSPPPPKLPPKAPATKAQLPARPKNAVPVAKPPGSTQAVLSAKSAKSAKPDIFTGAKDSVPAESTKLVYPPTLLIYSAGTPRIVFIACFRLTAIFLVIFTAVFVCPPYYYLPDQPTYLAFVFFGASFIPVALLSLSTGPLVTYVHLYLPAWARASKSRLERYAANLPKNAWVDISAMKWLWPRVSAVKAGELYIAEGTVMKFAMTLRRRVPEEVYKSRRWWHWRPIRKFYVSGSGGGKVPEKGIWEHVLGCVARASNAAAAKKGP